MASRRDFLRIGLGTAGAFGLASSVRRFGMVNALAQSAADYKAIVCVFLFGGNDGNNLIVPMDTARFDAYTNIRKDLALASAQLLQVGAGASQAPYGFHPKLAEVQTLFKNKNLAVVANVGTLVKPISKADYLAHTAVPVNLFSHSDQQLMWQSDVTSGFATSGWAGRVADVVSFMNAPATFPTFVSVAGNTLLGTGQTTRQATITPGAPLGLQGYDASAASTARKNALQQILTLNTGVTLVQAADQILGNGINDSATLSKALAGAPALTTTFPNTSIGQQMKQIAQLIQVRSALGMHRQIFFASLGGFDTHSNQLNDQDTLFSQLSPALMSFYNATQELNVAQQVTTFTESDFGRTFQSTVNRGSDHAWGNHHIVMGGAVQGGDIYGQFPQFALGGPDDTDTRGRWIPTTSVDQFGATLASWFGVGAGDLPTVFPNLLNFSKQNLGFLG
jgi:uncharacterized protein (DUF1501 family)